MQELPAEELTEDLIENGQAEEILQKSCPAQYSGLKEEEVTASRFRFNICFQLQVLGLMTGKLSVTIFKISVFQFV